MKKFKFAILLLLASLTIYGNSCQADVTKEDINYYHQQVAMYRYPWTVGGFMKACAKGETELAKYYVKGGFNINETYVGGGTPLLYAIYGGYTDIAEYLLQNGADPNMEIATLTPLHFAIRRQQPEMVNILIKYGANVNQECKNTKPLNFAIQKNNEEIVGSLVNAGAKPDEKTIKLIQKTKNNNIKNIINL